MILYIANIELISRPVNLSGISSELVPGYLLYLVEIVRCRYTPTGRCFNCHLEKRALGLPMKRFKLKWL